MFLNFTPRQNFGKALFPPHPFGGIPLNEALEFINVAGITNATQQLAIINLVGDLKAYGLWNKLKAIYPFVGGTANTHKFNLKDPRDVDGAFRLSFIGGWTHDSNGALPNGTNGYGNTFLNPFNTLPYNNTHLSYYTSTSAVLFNQREFSIYVGGGTPVFAIGTNSNLMISDQYDSSGQRISTTMTDGRGLICASRTAGNVHKAYQNGVQLGATNTGTSTQTLPNANLFLGAGNFTGAGIGQYSTKRYLFSSVGDGLTDADAANLYTAVQAYQTTLGRQV